MPTLSYYLIAYLDLLGQSNKLRQLQRLPRTPEERARVVETLASTALIVRDLRDAFARQFDNATSQEAIDSIPPENQAEFRRAYGVRPWFRGFSDSVVITVPLAGGEEIDSVAALTAVHRTLFAVSAVSLALLAAEDTPIRGGIDVGLGIEIVDHEYYGRALVEAYVLESQKADYPRILVGSGLFGYLAAIESATFRSSRLAALAISTVQDCRDLLVRDPTDDLWAVDPLWGLRDEENPQHLELVALGVRALRRVRQLADGFESSGDVKLARRYTRLANLFAVSPAAALIHG